MGFFHTKKDATSFECHWLPGSWALPRLSCCHVPAKQHQRGTLEPSCSSEALIPQPDSAKQAQVDTQVFAPVHLGGALEHQWSVQLLCLHFFKILSYGRHRWQLPHLEAKGLFRVLSLLHVLFSNWQHYSMTKLFIYWLQKLLANRGEKQRLPVLGQNQTQKENDKTQHTKSDAGSFLLPGMNTQHWCSRSALHTWGNLPMDPTHPTSLSEPQQRMSNFSMLLLPRAGTTEGMHQSYPLSWLRCREHFSFLHSGWDRAHLQEDKGRWRRVMQELREEETQADKSYLGNHPKTVTCRRGAEQLLTMEGTQDPSRWEPS